MYAAIEAKKDLMFSQIHCSRLVLVPISHDFSGNVTIFSLEKYSTDLKRLAAVLIHTLFEKNLYLSDVNLWQNLFIWLEGAGMIQRTLLEVALKSIAQVGDNSLNMLPIVNEAHPS